MPQSYTWTDRKRQELPTKRTLLKAYNAEAEALQALHVRMAKQLKRLELEEQMLLKILVTARDQLPADSHLLAEEPEELREVIKGVEPFTSGPLAAAAAEAVGVSDRQAGEAGSGESDSEPDEELGDGSADALEAAAGPGPSKRRRTGAAPGLYPRTSGEESSDEDWEDVAEEAAPTEAQEAAQPVESLPQCPRKHGAGAPGRNGRQAQAGVQSEEELSSGDEGREALQVDAPWG